MSLVEGRIMNEHEKLRSELIDVLKLDLFGPYHGPEETIDEIPIKRYLTGVLHPKNIMFEKDGDDGGIPQESRTSKDDTEEGLIMSNSSYPSCFGISFACPNNIRELEIFVKTGIYEMIAEEAEGNENVEAKRSAEKKSQDEEIRSKNQEVPGDKKQNNKKSMFLWKRKPIEWSDIIILENPREEKKDIYPGLQLRLKIRPPDENGIMALTLSLVNMYKPVKSQIDICKKSFFQVYFSAKGLKGKRPFVERRPYTEIPSDPEIRSINLLYRSTKSFAIGHGCSVDWKNEQNDRAGQIETSFVPWEPVFPIVSRTESGMPEFVIKEISESSSEQLHKMFSALCRTYDAWIVNKELEIEDLPEEYQETAKYHIELCKEASTRITSGIELLKKDRTVLKAFKLAHRAMLYHLAHSQWLNAGKPEDSPLKYDNTHKWHPFQIAFILQCLESLVDTNSRYRNIVDLLWFPTGGGKTEAYFGITAFVLFLRRLRGLQRGHNGGGTAVLTRYTLRLLTLDQFNRAVLLACSCEKVRKESGNDLNTSAPVSIGLWVGAEACPNRLEGAAKALKKLKSGGEEVSFSGDPRKLQECPWCGWDIGVADYDIDETETGMKIMCPNTRCYFHEGFPVWIIDEDVYRKRPSIIIGTVDKFARLPWLEEAGYLFGSDEKDPPPELIIQDELHLISGPLGTLVGLYETAVDLLCKRENQIGAKIVASTATIRNAQSQIRALFCRDVRQFPQPGLDYRDSFFAREDRNLPSRIYVGVFTPNMSPTTSLVRTFGCLLHASKIKMASDDIRDPYWTLMGYFLSLRELGGARRHIEDDVQDYLKFCAKRDKSGDESIILREVENVQELTSRVKSKDLEDIRKRLRDKFPDENCLDVVLATNMISVGLDVPRLGLMAIVGQPKSTAEYIQASSRIGRRYPGLVVNIFKWTHSRDRSHYERFKTYHNRLYSEVEASSVTPFSSRSRERGMHAVVISLIRHLVKGMGDNSAAIKFQDDDPAVIRIVNNLVERVRETDKGELEDTIRYIRTISDIWLKLCGNPDLSYWSRQSLSLLKPAEEKNGEEISFPTLNSLRNVDQSAGLYLLRS